MKNVTHRNCVENKKYKHKKAVVKQLSNDVALNLSFDIYMKSDRRGCHMKLVTARGDIDAVKYSIDQRGSQIACD